MASRVSFLPPLRAVLALVGKHTLNSETLMQIAQIGMAKAQTPLFMREALVQMRLPLY